MNTIALIPDADDDNRDFSISNASNLKWQADEGYDFEDIRCQFDPQIPFYEKTDYAVAASSGLIMGALDIFMNKSISLEDAHNWGSDQINKYVVKASNLVGYKGNDLEEAIKHLEKLFPLAGDGVTNEFGGPTKHHLRDFSHHPTIAGLLFSLLSQFTGRAFGTDEAGKIIFPFPKVPKKYIGKSIPEKIFFGTVFWMFHLISDMAGSSKTAGSGTGIPGPLLSFMQEASALPFFRTGKSGDENNQFADWLSDLFSGTTSTRGVKFDLRTEFGLFYNQIKHSIPVITNEIIVRSYFFISRLCVEFSDKKIKSIEQLNNIDIYRILPFKQRKLTRLLTISSGSFFALTSSVTVVKGLATEDLGSIILNLNYAGIARFGIAIKTDCPYIIEDINSIQEEIKERENLRTKFYQEQAIGISYFLLNPDQTQILMSLENQKIEYDISKSSSRKISSKKDWQDKWLTVLTENNKHPIIYDEPELYLFIRDIVNESNDDSWMSLVALELSRFIPYCPWGNDFEEDKKLKQLKLQSDYEYDVFTIMQNNVGRIEYQTLIDTLKHYENILNGTNKKIITGVTTTIALTVATGGLAFFAAPQIAVAIAGGSFTGLYGAALTNASLAAIGGGAIAAGGLGISGGTAIITGGGALLSLLGSGSASAIRFLSSKGNVITECANILTYCSLILKNKDNGKEMIQQVKDYLVESKSDFESDIAQMKASKSKEKDTKMIKTSQDNLKYISITIKELEKLMTDIH